MITMSRSEFELLFTHSPDITEGQIKQLKDLLWSYRDIFHTPGGPLSCTQLIADKIQLKPDTKDFKRGIYKCNPVLQRQIATQVKDMLDQGIIRPSLGNFCFSPVILVRKPDSTYRFVTFYRELNKI